MSRSYYVIELTARWLTVLLVALAAAMVIAFCLGYGAAVSVHAGGPALGVAPSPTPVVMTEVLVDPTVPQPGKTPTAPVATATPHPMPPTVVPPTRVPATATPQAKPSPTTPPDDGFWVQVLASSGEASIEEARAKLVGLGFDRDHQEVVRSEVAGGDELFKLRLGPFPNRASADRVVQRMQAADFPDAWVVVP
jgi:cell division septation protein DedD